MPEVNVFNRFLPISPKKEQLFSFLFVVSQFYDLFMRFKWNWKKHVIFQSKIFMFQKFHVSSRKVNLKIYLHQRGQFLDLSGRMGMKISTNTSIQMQVKPFININIFQTLFKLFSSSFQAKQKQYFSQFR